MYEITKEPPSEDKNGLSSQIRRASVSIPFNISEGAAKNYTKEFIRFLHLANESLSEVETQLILIVKIRL